MIPSDSYTLAIIGVVRSCFTEKFGIPRQPGLVTESKAYIELLPPYNNVDAVQGLDMVSHIWVQFLFHANKRQEWKSKVKPPRLGGNQQMGVFATRAPVRPNPIGLSAVTLETIKTYKTPQQTHVHLHIAAHDLLDGTPVVDIKPYVPYADSLPQAHNRFAAEPPEALAVNFLPEAKAACLQPKALAVNLLALIIQVLSQDPRPAYQRLVAGDSPIREYGMRLYSWEVKWRCTLLNGIDCAWVQSVVDEAP